jgi:HK97 family phage major capsid protein
MGAENIEDLQKQADELEARIKKGEAAQKKADEERAAALAGNSTAHLRVGPTQDSIESKALKLYGAKSAADLLSINVGAANFSWVPQEVKGYVLNFKDAFMNSRNMQQMFGDQPKDTNEDRPGKVKGILDGTSYARSVVAPMVKAFGSTTGGAGDEWVPTGMASSFVEEYELQREVVAKLRQMNLPTAPFDLPVQNAVTEARIQAENTALADSNFGTAKITFTPTKLSEFYILPEELNEDSAPAILQLARSEVVEAQSRAYEQAVINGDDSGTHQDNDTDGGSAILAAKAWKGLRKLGIAAGNTTDFGGATTQALMRTLRKDMGKYGVNPKELMWLVSPSVYNQMLAFADVVTMEKYGPHATVISGSLAAFDGIPIYISEYVRDDLADTGVNTVGGPNTFGTVLLVNHRRCWFGTRRPIHTKVIMDLPSQDRWLMSSWSRVDFQAHDQSAETSIQVGIEVLV